LDLSKLEAGKMELYPERFELGKLIEEIVAASEHDVAANSNMLVVECPDKRAVLDTDMAKLRQAVMNVMTNAARFTRDGTVTLDARLRNGMVDIAVKDTGPGIRPENLGNLFE